MFKIVEVAWIVVAVISALELVRLWGSGDVKFWYFLGFMAFAVFMFFFRRRQRQRMERYKREHPEEQ
ncbi:MAG: hypothetical protein ACPF9D_02555 [Owenweeksia sp.]